MGWKKDWVFLNIQIPPALNEALNAVTRKTGRSRADQTRSALMSQLGVDDLRKPYQTVKAVASNCNVGAVE